MLLAFKQKQKAFMLSWEAPSSKSKFGLASSHLPPCSRLPLEPKAGCQVALLGPITSTLNIKSASFASKSIT